MFFQVVSATREREILIVVDSSFSWGKKERSGNNDKKITSMFARPGRIRAYCSVSGGLDALRDAGGVSDVELLDARRPRVKREERMDNKDDDDVFFYEARRKEVETTAERRELHAQLNREDSAYGYSSTSNNNTSRQNRRNTNNNNNNNNNNSEEEEEGPTTPPNQRESEQPPPSVGAKRGAVPHSRSMPEFGEAKLWARRNRKQPQRLDVRLQCVQLGVIESPSSYA